MRHGGFFVVPVHQVFVKVKQIGLFVLSKTNSLAAVQLNVGEVVVGVKNVVGVVGFWVRQVD